MSDSKKLVDFITVSERLECEPRLTHMSDGKNQTVASHSWNMANMAIALYPYLETHVDMARVLQLCILHDLPEAVAHDVPLHQQTASVKKQKHNDEQKAIQMFDDLLNDKNIRSLFDEYEARQTPESRLVKLLDILDTGVSHLCAHDLSYVGTYNDNFYWKLFFSKEFADSFDVEPILKKVYNEIRDRVAKRLKQEQGIDVEIFYN